MKKFNPNYTLLIALPIDVLLAWIWSTHLMLDSRYHGADPIRLAIAALGGGLGLGMLLSFLLCAIAKAFAPARVNFLRSAMIITPWTTLLVLALVNLTRFLPK